MFDDFKDLLSAFNAGNVRYLIVGGYAVSLHAQPRATKDLDILISPDAANSAAVYLALTKFGAPVEGLSAKDFTEPDNFHFRLELLDLHGNRRRGEVQLLGRAREARMPRGRGKDPQLAEADILHLRRNT